jgi:nucleoside-diphosphate-sugar epimerase
VNVAGTRHVLEAARRARTPRVVYTSSLAVNSDTRGVVVDESYTFTGRHLSVYDATKAQAHRVALRFAAEGLPLVVAMPGVVYGPGDTSPTGRLIADVVAGRRVLVPDDGRLCWGFVDDVVHGHVLAMDRGAPGEAYMLAGPPHTLAAALRLAARVSGGRPPRTVPGAVTRGLGPVTGIVGRLLPLPSEYQAESLRAASATYLGSPAKAERELGWRARPLQEGMELTVRHLRAGAD